MAADSVAVKDFGLPLAGCSLVEGMVYDCKLADVEAGARVRDCMSAVAGVEVEEKALGTRTAVVEERAKRIFRSLQLYPGQVTPIYQSFAIAERAKQIAHTTIVVLPDRTEVADRTRSACMAAAAETVTVVGRTDVSDMKVEAAEAGIADIDLDSGDVGGRPYVVEGLVGRTAPEVVRRSQTRVAELSWAYHRTKQR